MHPEFGDFDNSERDPTKVEREPAPTMIVVGRGAVGKMITEVADKHGQRCLNLSHQEILHQKLSPDTPLILAIPNQAVGPFMTKLLQANPHAELPVIVLLQNGVGVVEQAWEAARELDDRRQLRIVRASLFTQVSLENDQPHYNPEKLRIALALADGSPDDLTTAAQQLFVSGFDVLTKETRPDGTEKEFDYKALEWLKLLLNSIGSTLMFFAADAEHDWTFAELMANPDIFKFEVRALNDRLRLLRKAGIELPNIPWAKTSFLPLLAKLEHVQSVAPIRRAVARFLGKQRNNRPSAATARVATWTENQEGVNLDEAKHYFSAWVSLAREFQHDLYPIPRVDATMVSILRQITMPQFPNHIVPAEMTLEEKLDKFKEVAETY